MVKFVIECEVPFSREDLWRIRASLGFRRHVVEDGLVKRFEASADVYDEEGWGTRTQEYTPAKIECPEFVRAFIGDTVFSVTDEQRWNDELSPYEQEFRIRPSFLAAACKSQGKLKLKEVDEKICDVCGDDVGEVCEHCCEEFVDDNDDLDDVDDDEFSSIESTTESDENTDSVDSDFRNSKSAQYMETLPKSERCRHILEGDTRVNVITLGWFIERAIVKNLRQFYREYPYTVARFRRKIYEEFANGDDSVPASIVVTRFLQNEERLAQERKDSGLDNDGLCLGVYEARTRAFTTTNSMSKSELMSPDDLDQDFASIFVTV